MATETITYDPTDDSVVIQQGEERDAENLEVGEKMMAEQDQLLAGKYKTTEDLEKAYKELESKLGSKDKLDTINREESKEEEATEPQYYSEDGSVNYETANELYGDKLGDVFKSNEIDPFAMNEHFQKNDGTLTDEMYEQLNKAGLNKTLVDSYLEGVRAQSGIENAPEAAVLNEQEIAEVKSIAGGEDGYEALMNWASDNMLDADAKNFDEVIETGNKDAVTFAIKALMGQY